MVIAFAYPFLLFLLVVPALLLAWVWKRDGGRLVLPFDHAPAASGRVWWVLVGLAESLPPLLLAVVIVLLAGPQRFGEPQAKRRLTNIELLVDVSYSMTAPFGDGSRYDTSMKAVDEFLNYRKGDAVGLTFFGNNVLHWVPLTSDASAIRCAPPFMRPEVAPVWMQGTEIGKALRECKKVLTQRQQGDRMIILITDGMSADLWGGNDAAVARELKENNIVVYAIHIGDERLPDEISTITGLTGGEVFHPDDPDALKGVFRHIDHMAKAPLEKSLAELKDNFFPYCVAALAALGLGALALFGLRYTPW
jgi:Ca-activated chloride channel family protein